VRDAVVRDPPSDPPADRGRPLVSVLLAAPSGAENLPGCLDSLAAQTLDPAEFEVVVVLHGPVDGAREAVTHFCRTHPEQRVRVLELTEHGLGNALNVGLSAARGSYVTVVGADDRVTAPYLEAMLDAAAPEVVVATPIGEPPEGAASEDPLVAALSEDAARLISTEIARLARYDPELVSGEDPAYWLSLFARRPFGLRVVADLGVLYLRPGSSGPGRRVAEYEVDVRQRLRSSRAIEAIDRTDPAVAALAHELMVVQAGRVNTYLREFPGDHPRVVADVAALGLRELPWSSVNEGLARDLAVCYCFPPYLDTSGVVAAKRLRARGLVSDVVSQDVSGLRILDPGSVRIADEVLARMRVVQGAASFSEWSAVPAFAEQAWEAVLEWEALQGPYRSVYSRAMAMNSHFAAALVKLRRPRIEWVAEFSDPLKINALGQERAGDVGDDWLSQELRAGMRAAGHDVGEQVALFDWAERIAYALADRIVFTNPSQMEMMLGYCADPTLAARVRSIAEISRHPVLPTRFYEQTAATLDRDGDAVHLAYFGVFYSTRDLGDIVQALVRLRQNERDRVRLHVFTSNPDKLTLEVVRVGLAGVVRVHPFVPVLEFLRLTTQFDVLVVNDAATASHHAVNPYLPSKVADYVGSGTAIWAICEPGSALSTMQFAHRSTLGDVDEALTVLRSLIGQHAPSSSV
jgi:hypothetical protein